MTIPTRPSRAYLRELWRAVRGDGCTAVPDLGFTECCNRHDADYRTHHDENGRRISRSRSDARLFLCMIRSKKHPHIARWTLATIFFTGVRMFGRNFWNRKPKD